MVVSRTFCVGFDSCLEIQPSKVSMFGFEPEATNGDFCAIFGALNQMKILSENFDQPVAVAEHLSVISELCLNHRQ